MHGNPISIEALAKGLELDLKEVREIIAELESGFSLDMIEMI